MTMQQYENAKIRITERIMDQLDQDADGLYEYFQLLPLAEQQIAQEIAELSQPECSQ